MRGLAGFNFKAGKLSEAQRQSLNEYLYVFDSIEGASEWADKDKTYLLRPTYTSLSIFGVGAYDIEKTDGIVWGSNESCLRQALEYIKVNDFFPFKVEENAVYFIEDGEVYLYLRKGDRITTPQGKGKIYSIDELNDLCVELDDDKDVFYEFAVSEVDKIKGK